MAVAPAVGEMETVISEKIDLCSALVRLSDLSFGGLSSTIPPWGVLGQQSHPSLNFECPLVYCRSRACCSIELALELESVTPSVLMGVPRFPP